MFNGEGYDQRGYRYQFCRSLRRLQLLRRQFAKDAAEITIFGIKWFIIGKCA